MRRAAHRSLPRRLERFVLGIAMSVVAFILERRVLKAIKAKGETPPRDPAGPVITENITLGDPPE